MDKHIKIKKNLRKKHVKRFLIVIFIILSIIFSIFAGYKILLSISTIKNEKVIGKVNFTNIINQNINMLNNKEFLKNLINNIDNRMKKNRFVKTSNDDDLVLEDNDKIIFLGYHKKKSDVGVSINLKINKRPENNISKLFYKLKKFNFAISDVNNTNYYIASYENPNPKNMQIEYKNNTICIVYENRRFSKGLYEDKDCGFPFYLNSVVYNGDVFIKNSYIEVGFKISSKDKIMANDFQLIIDSIFGK